MSCYGELVLKWLHHVSIAKYVVFPICTAMCRKQALASIRAESLSGKVQRLCRNTPSITRRLSQIAGHGAPHRAHRRHAAVFAALFARPKPIEHDFAALKKQESIEKPLPSPRS